MPEWIAVWSIRAALAAMTGYYLLGWAWPEKQSVHQTTEAIDSKRQSTRQAARIDWAPGKIASGCWGFGAICSLVHAVITMGHYHDWQHGLAFADTARQTKELLGAEVGYGIYFNYVFVLLWLIDATWMVAAPENYRRRWRWIGYTIHGYLLFIAFNGAVVFADGHVRWISLLAIVGIVLVRASLSRPSRQ